MLHPWMLWGLVGLSVPIIIHLIQRQRLRVQPLATLRFLDIEDAANAFAPVPRDWLQLLLRLLVLGLFIMLMARFAIGGEEVGPRTIAVVLDQSLSMQRKLGEQQNLFDQHKAHILELIDGLRPQDRMALFLVGDRVSTETPYLRDRDQLREAVQAFTVSDGGAQALVPTVRRIVGQLASRREVNAAVLVFSDQQRGHFQSYLDEADRGGDRNPTLAFRDRLERGNVKLFLLDEQVPAAPNLSIESAHFTPEQVYVGGSSRLTAVVRNHSQEKQTTHVQVATGEQTGKPRELTLEPGEAAHIDLVQRFEAPSDTACRVEIDADAYPGDDRFFLPMRIRDRKQILLVTPPADGDSQERGLEFSHRGTDLLVYALNPGEALGQSGTSITVKRVTPALFGRVSLPIYSVIILYGVTDLPEQSAKDLEAFVHNGGGVWLIPGADMSPLRFNEGHHRILNGFALGQLKRPEPVQALSRDESGLTHPLLTPLVREEWGPTRDIYFSHYHVVQAQGKAEVALRSAGGDPLAVVVRPERGRVFVQLFGAGLESSSLPRTNAFVPLVQQVAAVLGQRGEPQRVDALRVGEVRRMSLPEFRGLKGDVRVKGPADTTFPVVSAEAGEIRVEGLLRAGAYEVTHSAKASSRTRYLTVNPVLGESDNAILGAEEQATLFGTANVDRLTFADLGDRFARRHEVFAGMAVLVWIAFVIEALVGAWQARRKIRPAGTGGHAG
jgi:hypothetical protein